MRGKSWLTYWGRELRTLREELASDNGRREASEIKVSDLKAKVPRLQALNLATGELAEARTRLTEYAREKDDLRDRETTALNVSEIFKIAVKRVAYAAIASGQ